MKKFLILNHCITPMDANDEKPNQSIMEAWKIWYETHKDNVLDMGAPFITNNYVLNNGEIKASESGINGYMMIAAKDMDEAVELLIGSPLYPLEKENKIELLEIMTM